MFSFSDTICSVVILTYKFEFQNSEVHVYFACCILTFGFIPLYKDFKLLQWELPKVLLFLT